MDAHYIHLLLAHAPVVGYVTATLLLLFGVITRRHVVMQTALVLLMVFGLSVLPTKATGEGAEEKVEHLPGFDDKATHKLIHEHEEMAERAVILGIATALVSGAAFFMLRKGTLHAQKVVWVALAIAIFSGMGMAYTAKLGGQIRRPELRTDAPAPAPAVETGDND